MTSRNTHNASKRMTARYTVSHIVFDVVHKLSVNYIVILLYLQRTF